MGSQRLCRLCLSQDPQRQEQQQRESHNPTLALPDGQVQLFGPGSTSERLFRHCTKPNHRKTNSGLDPQFLDFRDQLCPVLMKDQGAIFSWWPDSRSNRPMP